MNQSLSPATADAQPTGAQLCQQVRDVATEQGWSDATLVNVLLGAVEGDAALAARVLALCMDIAAGDASTPAAPGERFEDFEQRYGCIQPPDGGTFSFQQVSATDPHLVWSLVDGEDGNVWLMPGFRVVNALGDYVKSERPWADDDTPSFRWDD